MEGIRSRRDYVGVAFSAYTAPSVGNSRIMELVLDDHKSQEGKIG
jgi:hypothetical protein